MATTLNQAQKQAVEYTQGPLLIVAGAGTGKTTVITQKIAHLIAQGLAKPEEILALTFTDKSAGEMEERVDQLVDIGYTEMQISTFHAFCQRLLENHGLDIGLPNRFDLLTETEAWLLVRENLDKFNLDYYRPLGNPTRHIHELLRHFGKCKDELITPESYLRHAEQVKLDGDDVNTGERSRLVEVANAYHVYNQLLLEHNAFDFGDLIFQSVRLLRERPLIRQALQTRFKYILVDEFQDVNYAQYELVKLLTVQSSACLPARQEFRVQSPQLTVVGDDDQSIYAFRGASVANILQFKEDFPDAKEVVLTENYRSGQEILDRAYQLIQNNNPDRLETKLSINKRLIAAVSRQPSAVSHFHFTTIDEEVRAVIAEIKKLKEEDGVVWDDFAILARANSHAEPFMEALERAGIPYEFLTSSGLHRQPIVVDCFNILRALNNYYDNFVIFGLLCLPCFELPEHDLVRFTKTTKQKSISYYEALKQARAFRLAKEAIAACEKLVSLIDAGVARARYEKPTTVLLEFLENSGYLSWLIRKEEEGSMEVLRSVRHLKQFFEFIDRYQETSPQARVAGFVEYYEQVLNSGDEGKLYQPTDTPASLNLMTAHAAKGLEFRYVFIVNCVEQRFPSLRRKEAIELPVALIKQPLPEGDYHEQEERRLFYVALTRAKERVYFTSASFYEGNKREKKVSRFVPEAGLEDKQDLSAISHFPFPIFSNEPAALQNRNNESEIIYEIPKVFSFSQLRAFQVCPYQYKLMYLLQIPVKQSHYFSFGNTMHVTLQRFYEQARVMNGAKQTSLFGAVEIKKIGGVVQVPPLSELLALYEKNWIADWYQSQSQREAYYKKGKEILRDFYKRHDGSWTVPAALEKGFRIKVGEYLVTGKIDRVDELADGSLHIIDYKTGQT